MTDGELSEIRVKHDRQGTYGESFPYSCIFCTDLSVIPWPCDAVRLLDEVERLKIGNAELEERLDWARESI